MVQLKEVQVQLKVDEAAELRMDWYCKISAGLSGEERRWRKKDGGVMKRGGWQLWPSGN